PLCRSGPSGSCGVVDHGNEDDLLAAALQPVVDAGIHLDQLAEAVAARPAAAAGIAAAFFAPEAFVDEPAAEGLGAELQAVELKHLLAGEGGAEVLAAGAAGLQGLRR